MKKLLLVAVALSTLTTEAGAVWFKIVHDFHGKWECRITEVSDPAGSNADDGSARFGRVILDATRSSKRTSMNITFVASDGRRYEKKSLYRDIFFLTNDWENPIKITWSGIGRGGSHRAVGELDVGTGSVTYVEWLYEDGELISRVTASACKGPTASTLLKERPR
jgi:hypothetical protein